MADYKWLRTNEGKVELRKGNFSPIIHFEVKELDPLVEKKLQEKGVTVISKKEELSDMYWYELKTEEENKVSITAPLYMFKEETAKYVKVSKSYTAKTEDPAEYDLTKETYERCCEEVKKEQTEIFRNMFREKTLDTITAVITISPENNDDPKCFWEKYVPAEYVRVCRINIPKVTGKYEVVFMRKFNAYGNTVTVKLPRYCRAKAVGRRGENIRRVEKIINSKLIIVK